MKTVNRIIAVIIIFSFAGFPQQKTVKYSLKNPNNFAVKDGYITIKTGTPEDNFTISDGDLFLPYQISKCSSGGLSAGLVIDLNPNEEKILLVTYDPGVRKSRFKTRTYAELAMKSGDVYYDGKFRGTSFTNMTKIKVPAIHTDHDALFKYEGPGWESEKVGYRFYLDWRNATDIFGKKKDTLILAEVGIHDTSAKDDSYHQMQDWGMDIFKVGNSLGIGSTGMMIDGKVIMISETDSIYCEINENGPVRSAVKTTYFGWKAGEKKYDIESELSITAGSRLTKNRIKISGDSPNIVTGLAKYPGTLYFESEMNGEWSYIALYGNQTLVSDNDKLGIAVFYRTKELKELTEDSLSHIIVLEPDDNKTEFYFCAAWEQEQDGIKNLEEFKNYLMEVQSLLNNPLTVNKK